MKYEYEFPMTVIFKGMPSVTETAKIRTREPIKQEELRAMIQDATQAVLNDNRIRSAESILQMVEEMNPDIEAFIAQNADYIIIREKNT